MWQDALRVCKEYVPHKLQQLQDEYDRVMTDKSTRYVGSEDLQLALSGSNGALKQIRWLFGDN